MFLLIKKAAGVFEGVSWRGWVGIVCVEILIVVIGVYLAAMMADLRNERQQAERQAFVLEALLTEIRPFVDQAEPLFEQFSDQLENWEDAQEAGERPIPFYIPATTFLSRPHSTLWNAMLESGGLGLMPVEFITRVSEFYDRIERTVERFYRIDEFSRDMILPNLDQGADAFYLSDSIELKPAYDVYQRELDALLGYGIDTVALGREIAESPFLGSINVSH